MLGGLLDKLPTRIAQSALKTADPSVANYALENRGIGSIEKMSADTEKAKNDLAGQINSHLLSKQYATHTGNGKQVLTDAASSFPHGKVTAKDMIATAHQLLGKPYFNLIQKLKTGKATLYERNILRQALDSATRSVYREGINNPTQAKNLGSALADALRNEVKTSAPETSPLFDELKKEIDLGKAVNKIKGKTPGNLVTFRDLLGANIGGMLGGAPGALGAGIGLGVEKLSTSPEGQFLLAKMLRGAAPAAKVTGKLTGALTTRGVSGL